jgi:DNA-directed RNA polymerase subunit RPC12/RpoP
MIRKVISKALLAEWDYSLNVLDPVQLTAGSGKQVYWTCSLSHSWKASIKNRSRGDRCPYCSHRKLLTGFNDLNYLYPEIARELIIKNNLDAQLILAYSTHNLTWECQLGHQYTQKVTERTRRGRNCPYCSNWKTLVGFNDLASKNQSLSQEWDYSTNGIAPSNVTYRSSRKVNWICRKCSTKWNAAISSRVDGSGCPHCANKNRSISSRQSAAKRSGSFAQKYSQLAIEWSCLNSFGADQVSSLSQKQVLWNCCNGHEWKSSIRSRTRGSSCPYCHHTYDSILEREIAFFVSQSTSNKVILHNRLLLGGREIDLYLPELGLGIEINGNYWHSDQVISKRFGISAQQYHQLKSKQARQAKTTLAFVWEDEWRNDGDRTKKKLENFLMTGNNSELQRFQ